MNSCKIDGATALFIAAQNKRRDVVGRLLAYGAVPGCKTEKGAAPISIAAENGDLEVLELLVENGAEVNIQKSDGATPLFMSAQVSPNQNYS